MRPSIPVQECRLDRLSTLIDREFGLELSHEALVKLGYKAEQKEGNRNTYYTVPGAPNIIDNAPKVITYIREHSKTKEGARQLLGTSKVSNRSMHCCIGTVTVHIGCRM